MKADRHSNVSFAPQILRRFIRTVAPALTLAVGVCGIVLAPPSAYAFPPDQPYVDNTAYAFGATDGLAASTLSEKAAVAYHQLTYKEGGRRVDYTTTTGHLTAKDANGNPEASMFYVAYIAKNRGPFPRPITFFYNGGPGSSSIWLRLGSFAPSRVATPDPYTTGWPNFPLVDNEESLIDTTDMVFIDPPGTGFSEAVLPNTNQSFWGVDQDAGVMRDFILRYLAVNPRPNSPIYLYGESYGTPRTDVLAPLLQQAGVKLTGIVLQSCILDYNDQYPSTSDLQRATDYTVSLLPGYAEVAAFFGLVTPPPPFGLQVTPPLPWLRNFAQMMRDFSTRDYAQFLPYGPTFLGLANPPVFPTPAVYTQLSSESTVNVSALTAYLGPNPLNTALIPGYTIGGYDGRVSAPNNSPIIASDSDPSDALMSTPFPLILNQQLPNYLKYTAPNTTYVTLSDTANENWDFSHGGLSEPDTIPDLLAALTLNPHLKVLVENGYHDLVTPFFMTEKDLGRLKSVKGIHPDIQVTHYAGGHMIYLEDTSRPHMKRDLVSYYYGFPIEGAMRFHQLPKPWSDQPPAGTP